MVRRISVVIGHIIFDYQSFRPNPYQGNIFFGYSYNSADFNSAGRADLNG